MKNVLILSTVVLILGTACVTPTEPVPLVCTIVVDLKTGQAHLIDSLSTWDCLENGNPKDTVRQLQ